MPQFIFFGPSLRANAAFHFRAVCPRAQDNAVDTEPAKGTNGELIHLTGSTAPPIVTVSQST